TLSAFDQTHRFLLEFVRVTRTIRFVRHLILLALITSHRKGYVFRGQDQDGNVKRTVPLEREGRGGDGVGLRKGATNRAPADASDA
ncbi:MAG: hypothetical protein LBJ59_00330, partial [Zoogloeaceae bacterium]|nr:hypothetical protein [Zoogloeaceae bacterium]